MSLESHEGAAKTKFGIDSPWVLGGLTLIVWGALLVPVFSVSYLPQVDLPNHLARQYIGANADASRHLSNFYDFEWRWIPYMLGDALSIGLNKAFSIYDVGRFVLGLSLALWLSAAMLLHRSLWGSFSAWPLLSAFVLFNANVAWGFQNYFLASSLSVFAFTLWTAWSPKRDIVKHVVFFLISTFIYFSHLFSFCLLGLLVLSYEGWIIYRRGERRVFIILRHFFIVGALFLGGISHFGFMMLSSPPKLGSFSGYISPTHHLEALISSTLSGPGLYFGGWFDLFVLLMLSIILFVGLRVYCWFEIHPAMVGVIAALGITAFIMPAWVSGVGLAHYRLPFVLVVFLIAGSRWNAPPEAWRWGCAACFGILLAFRIFAIEGQWKTHELEVAELIQGLSKMEKGGRLLQVFNGDVVGEERHWHSASYAVIEREAYVPTLFTGVTMLRVAPPFQRIARGGLGVPLTALPVPGGSDEGKPTGYSSGWRVWRRWWQDYSHVLVFDRGEPVNPFPDRLMPLSRGSYFVLYRNTGFASASGAAKSAAGVGQK